jgi:DNA-binding response OmpR family regulator
MYSEWLTWRGIRVTAVPTARDALAVINRADAVIACLRLSDGDAFALFSAIRASSHSVPIVALSTCMPDHERAACDQQIDAVLLKPCLPGALHEVLKKKLTRRQAETWTGIVDTAALGAPMAAAAHRL